MDLQEKRQHDLARQMAMVKAHSRPWRSIIAAVLAVLAGLLAATVNSDFTGWTEPRHYPSKIITAVAAAGFCLFAVLATVGLAGKARDVLGSAIGSAHAAIVRYAILLTGGVATPVFTLELLKISVGQLILGGAVTGILIGIAGQQALANVFAGIVLLLSRPFGVGDSIQLRSGALAGQIVGTVTEIGITYLRLETQDGPLHLPNSQVLAAAVGPAAARPPEADRDDPPGSIKYPDGSQPPGSS